MDFDIVKLADLLNPKKTDGSESEDEIDDDQPNKDAGPSPQNIEKRKQSVYAKQEVTERKTPDALNSENEAALYFPEEAEAASDWRKTPQWNVSYKQQVTSSDVFLQMSAKSLATASCEDMILKIHLPEDDHHNIDLKITKDHLKLVSPKYRLEVPLPHPVDPQCGNAKWDKDTEELIVTLRMNREFDFINF